jgi:hypothetical protein
MLVNRFSVFRAAIKQADLDIRQASFNGVNLRWLCCCLVRPAFGSPKPPQRELPDEIGSVDDGDDQNNRTGNDFMNGAVERCNRVRHRNVLFEIIDFERGSHRNAPRSPD